MSALPVSIVMCSRDRPELLGDTVRSVLATHPCRRSSSWSTRATCPTPRSPRWATVGGCRVVHVPSTTRGLSRARNIGLRAAAHPVVVLLDDDMFVEPGWLEPARGRRRRVAAGRRDRPRPRRPARGRRRRAPAGRARTPTRSRAWPAARSRATSCPARTSPSTATWCSRSAATTSASAPGTRFGAADDNDMGHRLLRAGATIRHEPALRRPAPRLAPARGAAAAALGLRPGEGRLLRQAPAAARRLDRRAARARRRAARPAGGRRAAAGAAHDRGRARLDRRHPRRRGRVAAPRAPGGGAACERLTPRGAGSRRTRASAPGGIASATRRCWSRGAPPSR